MTNTPRLRLLFLEPYYGGSHQAFIDGWRAHSRHQLTVLGLPAYKWKWRMRHAPTTLATMTPERAADCEQWDVLLCSDMLNLPEYRGFAPEEVRQLPSIAYFHENQLTYPVNEVHERDLHFGFTNYVTASAANEVWFNSLYHCHSFLDAVKSLLQRMPDYVDMGSVEGIREKSRVLSPGIDRVSHFRRQPKRCTRFLWTARWEHDKDPETFFEAFYHLARRGRPFEVAVAGESFGEHPDVFDEARARLSDHIVHWGYEQDRAGYFDLLRSSDIVVSTAKHEFFGMGILEAVAAGCFPLVPKRLAYPEILGLDQVPCTDDYFYDGSSRQLVVRLEELIERERSAQLWVADRRNQLTEHIRGYYWDQAARRLDDAVAGVMHN